VKKEDEKKGGVKIEKKRATKLGPSQRPLRHFYDCEK